MAATAQVPDGFEIDPATGMPRLKRQQSTVAAVQPAIDSPFAPQAPTTAAAPTTPYTSSAPATTGATFLPNTVKPPSDPNEPPQAPDPGTVTPTTPPTTAPPPLPPPIHDAPTFDEINKARAAKNWQLMFSLLAKSTKYGNNPAGSDPLKDPAFVKSLTDFGFHISPANAVGEVTKIQTPDGHWVRVLGGPREGYTWTWVDNGDGSTQATTAPPQTPTDPLAGITPWQEDPAFHEAILRLLKQGETPVSADDPTIKATTDAARVAGTREVQQARASAAERAAAEGVPTSTFDNAVLGNQEKFGENMSGLEAQLMTTELQNRRAQVVSALQLASGEDARKLQAYLGNIDAALRKAGLSQQNQQFYDTLSFNYTSEEDLMNRFIQSLLLKPAA